MSHVIVCGLGQVGYRVATLLLELGEELTVITLTAREEWVRNLRDGGAQVLLGDATDEKLLHEANLEAAVAIIACTHDDSANIEIILDARRLFPGKRTIARIVDPNLAQQAERHLGVHRAIAMTSAAAPTFAAATYGDHVLTELNVDEERFLALRMTGPHKLHEHPLVVIGPDGICTNEKNRELAEGSVAVVFSGSDKLAEQVPKKTHHHKALARALAPHHLFAFVHGIWKHTSIQLRALVIAAIGMAIVSVLVFRYEMKLSLMDSIYFVVTTATTIGYGDITPKDASMWVKVYTCFMMVGSAAGMAVVFSMVTDYILTARLMQLVGRHQTSERGHVIVVGVGVVGHRVADELIRLKAHVLLIDRDDNNEFLTTLRTQVPVVIGDARERETLMRAGIMHAKAIITLTSSDAANLSIGLTAKELNPDVRAVLSIFDVDFARKIQSIPEFDVALSPPLLAAPAFVGAALYDSAVASFRVGHHFFTLCEDESGEVRLGGKRMRLETRELRR